MEADGQGSADRNARAVVAVLVSALLASCTTSGPITGAASPSYSSTSMVSMMAEAAQSEGADLNAGDGAIAAEAPDANETAQAAAAVEPAEAAPAQTAAAAAAQAAPAARPEKRSFLASLFSARSAQPAPAAKTAFAPMQEPVASAPVREAENEAKPLVDLSSRERPVKLASLGDDALPGVRKTTNLFEITHKSGIGDNSDVDLYEGENAPVVLASAAGLARLAPNGLLRQRESVDVACLKPELVRLLKTVERHFGKRMVITSGYRSPAYNKKVRGAERSQHMYCAAADVQIPGVSKWEIAKLVRAMPRRGGVGTYCHTQSVHIDVGPERDWNWRCRS